MNTKLQELTDKIYLEGVEKGNAEAKEIVERAEQEAVNILASAKAEADKIRANAEVKAIELKKKTESELRLFAQQAVNALKTEITDLICGDIVSDSVKAATSDKVFMQKMILSLVQNWAKSDKLTIETKEAAALKTYFEANAKELLNKGLKITEVNQIKSDFAISVEDKEYKITLGEAEFVEYFKEFLRPELIKMLF